MSRKVQWATLVAKREKLSSKVASLDETKDELDALNEQIASLITPEAIADAKAKLEKLRKDEARAVETMIGLVTEARKNEAEVPEDAAAIVDEFLAAERAEFEAEVEPAGLSPDEIED